MRKVTPAGVVTKGLDVSHYDQVIDFEKVKASGREFVFAKCTEYNADKMYARNRDAARAAGLLFGAYHFFHPKRDAKEQAELFIKNAKLENGDLHPVLDWETTDNIPSNLDRARAKMWLDLIEAAYGKAPIIYGGPYFLQALNLDVTFSKYPLWVAHYGTSTPMVPDPWRVWTFWQHTDKGEVPGIPADNEDLDLFNGPLENLRKLTI
jgi:lysozyme